MKTILMLALAAFAVMFSFLGVVQAEPKGKANDIVAVAAGNGAIHVIDTEVLPN